jgi:hypothetical protein
MTEICRYLVETFVERHLLILGLFIEKSLVEQQPHGSESP